MDEVMGTGNDVKQEKGREAPSGGRVTIRELAEAAGVSSDDQRQPLLPVWL